jgi:hypothetical protein
VPIELDLRVEAPQWPCHGRVKATPSWLQLDHRYYTMDAAAAHSIPAQTIRAAYTEIGRRVNTALRTQVGDAARLGEQRRECLRLLTLVGQVSLCIQLISGASHSLLACRSLLC